MKSWAVTKGPSYDPADKRLAVRTEDHPVEYNEFEGVIPDKQYGAGPVMIWDEGIWYPDADPEKMEKKGHITFTIKGSRMHGHWHLVRMRTAEKRENWLLIKGDDDHKLTKAKNAQFLKKENTSIVSGRTMDEIRKAGLGKTAKRNKRKKSPAQDNSKNQNKSVSLTALLKKYGSPELATLVENPPATNDWVHEIKYDGYRLMAFIANGKVVLQTRGGKDWTHKFQPLADALNELNVESAVLDLEACVLDKNGRTSFSMLQEALSKEAPNPIEGWVFDMLYLNGEDFTKTPLLERKNVLQGVLKKSKPRIHYSEHFESAPHLLEKACKIGAEGLVSKRKDSIYQHRRTKDWVKSKCGLEQEFVIGGYMPAKDFPKAVGALLLGYYKDNKFHYAGKVGTGFSRTVSKDIYKRLIALKTNTSPFPAKEKRGLRDHIYVEPKLLCEVSFFEWTPEGHIRHASFKGLREDKNPKAVVEEKPEKMSSAIKKGKNLVVDDVVITHPEREIFPGSDITKGDIAAYYAKIAPLMHPFLEDRLISLLRCTQGINGECFFQRNPMQGMGDHIKPKKVTHKGKMHEYLYIDNDQGIVQLAQMGTIEFHAWQSRLSTKGKPDQIIFDLDPDEGVPFEAIKLAAQDIRARLKTLKLESFARLSGGKGIHVVAPIKPEHSWDEIKEFARSFAEDMAADAPDAYVANMSKKKRTGKIFIDFFRNDFSSTAIVPFSLRAREGAALAWPISWADLERVKSASQYKLNALKPSDFKKAEKESRAFLEIKQSLKL